MTKFDAESCLNSIRQTEEAIERQHALLASTTDAFLAKIAQRSLATLEDMLSIQHRTYRMLTATAAATIPHWGEHRASESGWREQLPHEPASHRIGLPPVGADMGPET